MRTARAAGGNNEEDEKHHVGLVADLLSNCTSGRRGIRTRWQALLLVEELACDGRCVRQPDFLTGSASPRGSGSRWMIAAWGHAEICVVDTYAGGTCPWKTFKANQFSTAQRSIA